MFKKEELDNKLLTELKEIAKSMNIKKADSTKKEELVYKILDAQAMNPSEEMLEQEKKTIRPGRPRKRILGKGSSDHKPPGKPSETKKTETTPESRPEAKTEVKPETKQEARPEARQEARQIGRAHV